jgi:hypothetical protein
MTATLRLRRLAWLTGPLRWASGVIVVIAFVGLTALAPSRGGARNVATPTSTDGRVVFTTDAEVGDGRDACWEAVFDRLADVLCAGGAGLGGDRDERFT